jgi:putative aldouronate transport system permease protein
MIKANRFATVNSVPANEFSIRCSMAFKMIRNHWQLYALIFIPVVLVFIFCYVPMYGAMLAFKSFDPVAGIMGSPWVGLKNFERFFSSPYSLEVILNTFILSIQALIIGLPFPIILAIAINEAKIKWFSKTVQMVTYAPYFISTVIMVALIMQWTDFRSGILNTIILPHIKKACNI